ncbi:hypothetical protein [Roseivirga sp. E12]|uniref:hypothetical protein n=1 Tax=Roseivirga sp. E12 TaxID=2819237 RepID=UPI001ABD41A0|nr:hypothetical protein [Roseivirga sp. E12]MBO3696881.1 hypothetical protein [Roseivirga sp. E12]
MIIALLGLCLMGCQPFKRFESKRVIQIPTGNCTTTESAIRHALNRGNRGWNRTIELPTSGRFVEESHYVTSSEKLASSWPKTKTEGIQHHLKESLKIYRRFEPKASLTDLYPNSWNKEWTPEEGGRFGQGSVGDLQRSELTTSMEMWFMTMMWAKGERPKPGTKFLLSANDKRIIVVAGFETGPSDQKYLGGVTREVHHWLGTNSQDSIKVQLLGNHSLDPGPIRCH